MALYKFTLLIKLFARDEMMKKNSILILILCCLTAACTLTTTEPNEQGFKQSVGTVTGMLLGAKVANDLSKGSKNEGLWTMAGVTLGAFMGNEIGAALDQQDLLMARSAQNQALEYNKMNQRSSWNNPDSWNSGMIYPTNTYQNGNQPCREFMQEINIGGEIHKAFGRACRRSDGTWDLVP